MASPAGAAGAGRWHRPVVRMVPIYRRRPGWPSSCSIGRGSDGWRGGRCGTRPGADMRPLARLRQPRLDVTQVVLDGASGRVLAFGPGHVTGSALPGVNGNIVISGHRDTHFRWLRDLHRW